MTRDIKTYLETFCLPIFNSSITYIFREWLFNFFFYIKRVLIKEKQKYVKKISIVPRPVKRTVGKI